MMITAVFLFAMDVLYEPINLHIIRFRQDSVAEIENIAFGVAEILKHLIYLFLHNGPIAEEYRWVEIALQSLLADYFSCAGEFYAPIHPDDLAIDICKILKHCAGIRAEVYARDLVML